MDEVIPDVTDALGLVPPTSKFDMTIVYGSTNYVNMGNELSSDCCSTAPKIEYYSPNNELYTLAMVDPDAPSKKNPINKEWRHWGMFKWKYNLSLILVVINIPGNEIYKGKEISKYMGPSPPKGIYFFFVFTLRVSPFDFLGSGPHRYFFVLYKQSGNLVIDHFDDTDRRRWNLFKFAKEYALGNPVSVKFFKMQKE
jgi:phosphatidylethanolamine-binding protein